MSDQREDRAVEKILQMVCKDLGIAAGLRQAFRSGYAACEQQRPLSSDSRIARLESVLRQWLRTDGMWYCRCGWLLGQGVERCDSCTSVRPYDPSDQPRRAIKKDDERLSALKAWTEEADRCSERLDRRISRIHKDDREAAHRQADVERRLSELEVVACP